MIVVRRGRPRERLRRSSEVDDLFRAMMSSRNHDTWRPPLDVYETGNGIEVVAEIAGMDREEIEVTIEGDVISIRGTRPDPATCDHRSFHQARIAYGAFGVDIFIPFAIDGELAAASYENGFLKITVPKAEPRTIVPGSAPSESHDESPEDHDRSHA